MTRKLYLLWVLALAISYNLNAQCYNVTLTSQADVDSYQSTYGCAAIPGTLMIMGRDISNLTGLIGITSVGALYVTDCPQLFSLVGLNNLTSIAGPNPESLRIARNESLNNIEGLNQITSIPGKITIQANPQMIDINALSALTTVSGRGANIYINGNSSLRNIDGLKSLSTFSAGDIGGVISISYNPVLENINGLSSLTHLDGGAEGALEIFHNEALVNLDGIASLTKISTDSPSKHAELKISENFALANGCGAYKILSSNDPNLDVAMSNNGSVTQASIIAGGPCATVGCDGDITLNSQADVDAFPSTHHCSVINGTLTIMGNDITNLDSLSQLTKVAQIDLRYNPQLTHIYGFSHLTEVGHFSIISNVALLDLEGLESLTTVEGFQFTENRSMHNFHGLENITTLKDLSIYYQPLDDFTGLSGLTTITGSVDMSNNSIQSFSGLSSLTSIAGPFSMRYDSTLTSFEGLSALNTMRQVELMYNQKLQTMGMSALQATGSIIVIGNPALLDFDGLTSLTTIGNLEISENKSLQSVSGFSSLTTLANGGIALLKNPMLQSLSGFDNVATIPGSVLIFDNDALHDLTGLSATSVGVLVVSGNASLESFDGANNLTKITSPCGCPSGGLQISDNANLTNIDALSNLTTIASSLEITDNPKLINIDALSSVTHVGRRSDFGDGSLTIGGNTTLKSIQGLKNVPGVSGSVFIYGNDSLKNLNGLGKLTTTGGFGFGITDNASLENIDALSKITFVAGGLNISNNPSLKNLNGLGSLTSISGVKASPAVLQISNNASLTNVDSLGRLTSMTGVTNTLTVINNSNLTKGCGLYPIIHSTFSCDRCGTISGNGEGVTKEEILDNGPCEGGSEPQTPPAATDLVFSNVTDNSMSVSFTSNQTDERFITIMRSFEPGLPDNGPQDGTTYNVGNVIGCCTIVVGNGTDTHLSPIYLESDIEYYFDIIPYEITNGAPDYFPDKALSGHQRTLPQSQPYPNPFVEELVIPVTVADENSTVKILITDQLGRPVSEIVTTLDSAGKHEIKWNRADSNGNRVGNGVYTYSVSTPKNSVKGLVMAK